MEKKKSSFIPILIAWLFVGIPLLWGIVQTLLKSLAEETGKGILVSTHDLDITLQTAHELWLSNFGSPLISGTPEDLVLDGSLSKTFYREGGKIRLQPANPRFDPIVVKECKVQGVVIGVLSAGIICELVGR